MKFLNQLEYSHVPYRTKVRVEGLTEEQRKTNVAQSGCGLCCACMVVDYLTDKTLELEDCVRLSEQCVANHSPGTDLGVLGPVLAEKFDLNYKKTNDLSETIAHLKNGGVAVVLVGVPEGRERGLFTGWGHYMLLVSTDGEKFCILDPSYTEQKYELPDRIGRVNEANAPYLYCEVKTVDSEEFTKFDWGKYHLFSRKKV